MQINLENEHNIKENTTWWLFHCHLRTCRSKIFITYMNR
jgi:hypothetical protein